MIKKYVKISLITTAVSLVSMADSFAATDIAMRANTNCVDLAGSLGSAQFTLPLGRYAVSLVNNTMACGSAGRVGSCAINSVILKAVPTAGNFTSQATWGLSITAAPTVVDISATTGVAAFVIDTLCSDNLGTSTLRFQKAQ